jgi:hypothetical protein
VSERRRPLPLVPARAAIEGPTIMDRTLAAAHGASYVQLAAFAIDVDRVYAEVEDDEDDAAQLPFGWEVFLVQEYLRVRLRPTDAGVPLLLEETCLAILAQAPDAQGFGSQLVFAVHDGVRRGLYPEALQRVFASWRPAAHRQLERALEALRAERERALPRLARHCLDHAPDPGLAPPTREALQLMADGLWPVPPR